ncbi:hypothetical protein TNCV_3999641 [Trichonephila clavipes]|nr:hypothetical protein TNCV_3999641 [Trichonephila clavipes]
MPAMIRYLNHWTTAALRSIAKSPRVAEQSDVNIHSLTHSATQGLLATDHVILNHGQVTWRTPELWYWARTHDILTMIRHLDHQATAGHVMLRYPVSGTVVTHVLAAVAWGPSIIDTADTVVATPLALGPPGTPDAFSMQGCTLPPWVRH